MQPRRQRLAARQRETIVALCVRVSFDRLRAPTCPCPAQRDRNSGRWVSTTSNGTALTRSISRSNTSSVVGSAHWVSSNSITLGRCRAVASVRSTKVLSVSSLNFCGVLGRAP